MMTLSEGDSLFLFRRIVGRMSFEKENDHVGLYCDHLDKSYDFYNFISYNDITKYRTGGKQMGGTERKTISLMKNWTFTMPGRKAEHVDLPHTWNNLDGQDGGNDYKRLECSYECTFHAPEFDEKSQQVYLEFDGVNASGTVFVNGVEAMHHDGGYSTFRVDITELLQAENDLKVLVDNSVNDYVYPQKADFTFYGGIYRDVKLVIVPRVHFDLDYFGGNGLKVSAKPVHEYRDGEIEIELFSVPEAEEAEVYLLDKEGKNLFTQKIEMRSGRGNVKVLLPGITLWDGLKNPYLYTAQAVLLKQDSVQDKVSRRFGIRDFRIDEKKGFFLNGRSYPLHGVSRHQDRKNMGNAIAEEEHWEDFALIREVGANTIRLAHYQHSQIFYDLCDEAGMIVWAEIPYISEHLPNGRENTISQMKELIVQNYHHPSICFWGISNEITISTKDHKDMMENHRILNDLCHEMDSSRLTTLACYAACMPWDSVVHKVSDVVGYNYYLGWYTPFLWLNDVIMRLFHLVYPHRRVCYSEYGAEAMPNLHSRNPRRGDHTEEYQLTYLEYMLKFFDRNPWMWGNYLWNMFDFAADARNQGGEPGMNHKGLVTFDRKTKKDSFYLYKAWWSEVPFIHICGKRRKDREEAKTIIKVYSNQKKLSLYVNGRLTEEQTGDKIFTFCIPMQETLKIEVRSGDICDCAEFSKVSAPNQEYRLKKNQSTSENWT